MSTVTMLSEDATPDFARKLFPKRDVMYKVTLTFDPSKIAPGTTRLDSIIEMLRKKFFKCEAPEYQKLMRIPQDEFEITFHCLGRSFNNDAIMNRATIYLYFASECGVISKIETTSVE